MKRNIFVITVEVYNYKGADYTTVHEHQYFRRFKKALKYAESLVRREFWYSPYGEMRKIFASDNRLLKHSLPNCITAGERGSKDERELQWFEPIDNDPIETRLKVSIRISKSILQ